jgi:hypothetical protein
MAFFSSAIRTFELFFRPGCMGNTSPRSMSHIAKTLAAHRMKGCISAATNLCAHPDYQKPPNLLALQPRHRQTLLLSTASSKLGPSKKGFLDPGLCHASSDHQKFCFPIYCTLHSSYRSSLGHGSVIELHARTHGSLIEQSMRPRGMAPARQHIPPAHGAH